MKRCLLLLPLLALAGCADGDEATKAEVEVLELDLDIRDHAQVRIERRGSALQVSLTPTRAFGVAEDGAKLMGKGTLERFPEADLLLFTARFSGVAVAGGPCGDQPVSLALALHRRGTAPRVSGSLTPYCGKDVWAGVPARNPLRLTTSAAPVE